ncbi:hypothetical protein FYJ84_13230 [Veillonellaceae bacterium WCA-693-APC-5D-A]|uniref:Uncharacterized protein n=1 Tax=Anaerovibrio slackiae TaxID=2652309 RepID=A0A6I2ULR6_9FIRM|nr:hypothetical protein [Anaerovibrio slackiae]MSU09932.1 hypothetical protein [Anaerovibrio slackiae]
MSDWWKNGLLVAAGGVAGLALAAWLESEDKSDYWDYDEEVERAKVKALKSDGMKILVEKVKSEAEWAMEECATDEEREAVYAEVEETVKKLQAKLAKHGEKIIESLKAQATEAQMTDEEESGFMENGQEKAVRNFKSKMEDLTKSLDETLASIKPETAPTGA